MSTIRDLTIGSSRKPRTSRSHVTSTLQVCGLRFTFVRLNHALEVGDSPQGFFASYNVTIPHLRENTTFRTLLLISYGIFSWKRNF